jgi:hypothetical protein
MTLMRSIVASFAGWLVATALGCGATGDRLAAALALQAAAVAATDAATAAHAAAYRADLLARIAACPESPQAERAACVHDATTAALAAAQGDRLALQMLALAEVEVADALDAATECRAAQTSCEADYLDSAERRLAEVRAQLARRAADAGAEGGGTP